MIAARVSQDFNDPDTMGGGAAQGLWLWNLAAAAGVHILRIDHYLPVRQGVGISLIFMSTTAWPVTVFGVVHFLV